MGYKATKIDEQDFRDAVNDNAGWCINCAEFTNDSGVEPDAENYECEVCGHNSVMGAEQALIEGYVDFE
jgi:hypothetical protein